MTQVVRKYSRQPYCKEVDNGGRLIEQHTGNNTEDPVMIISLAYYS